MDLGGEVATRRPFTFPLAFLVVWTLTTPWALAEDAPTSCVLSFDESAEGFVKVNPQTHSDVAWDKANGRVRVHADKRDPESEFLQRALPTTLTPADSFSVTERWNVVEQGDQQAAVPFLLALGDLPNGDPLGPPNRLGILYAGNSGDEAPGFRLFYRDESGVTRIDETIGADADAEYRLTAEYNAETKEVALRIRDANAVQLFASSYTVGSHVDDGFQFEQFAIGTGTRVFFSEPPPLEGWVDDIIASFIDASLPCPVRMLSATAGFAPGDVGLVWAPPANAELTGVTGYRILRAAAAEGPYALVAQVGDVLAFTDAAPPQNERRYYRVTALASNGEGTFAKTLVVGPPEAPLALGTKTGPGMGQVRLVWEPPLDDGGLPIVGYQVQRGPDDDGPFEPGGSTPNLTFTDEGLLPASVWFYRVVARNALGAGGPSDVGVGTSLLACASNWCVGAPFVHYEQDFGPPSSASLVPAHVIELEPGTLHVEAMGEYAEALLVVPRVDGTPDPSLLNSQGQVQIHYSELPCFLPPCEFLIPEPGLGYTKLGEVWAARFQVFENDALILNLPFSGARLDLD